MVGRRLFSFALILLGALGTGYALGEKLPGHSHAHSHTIGNAQLSPEADGRFTLRTSDGRAVTGFEIVHQAAIHVLMVRPDLSRLVHTHPLPADDGSFTVVAPDASTWEAVAEATPAGSSTALVGRTTLNPAPTIGSDTAATAATPPPAPVLSDSAVVGGDTVRVTLDGDRLLIDAPHAAEDYLGAPAHIVAFRLGDHAYAHLHATRVDQSTLRFDRASLPTGLSRVFVQFAYRGEVATLALWVPR